MALTSERVQKQKISGGNAISKKLILKKFRLARGGINIKTMVYWKKTVGRMDY